MKRLTKLAFAISVMLSSFAAQPAWARPARNKHHVQHHKVRHAQRHKPRRTGT